MGGERTAEQGRAGFSLAELAFVLLIVGVIAGMAFPRIDFKRARVDAAAVSAGSQLLRAQRVAVLRQHDVRVSFDADEGALLIHDDVDNDGTVDDGEPTRVEALGEKTYFGSVGDALFGDGDAITFELDDAELPTVVYHRNGSASEEGVVHITSESPVGEEHDRAIRVTRATGLARCWTRRNGDWKEGC